MPHFEFEMDAEGRLRTVWKDGVAIEGGTRLEMPSAIVRTYFESAAGNLNRMTGRENDVAQNRLHGLQCFLMGLVGVEAFLNVFFHLVGRERKLANVVELANKDKATIEHKLAHLPCQAFGSPLPAQKRLNRKMRELYDLRSSIVHPKWQPSSLAMPGFSIDGLVENQQQIFEDRDFCHEALLWCLLVVARIGIHAGGRTPNAYFVFQWTSLQEDNASLSKALTIPEDSA